MTNKTSITVNHQELAKWRVIKAEVERDSGKSLSWEQFLDHVIHSFQHIDQIPVARMAQERDEETDETVQIVKDDALTLEVAAMTGHRAHLSEETCDLIAEMVADKVIEKLGRLDSGQTEGSSVVKPGD